MKTTITSKANRSIIAIIGLLLFTAVSVFLRSYIHEPSGDELLYQYAWEKDDPTDLWEDNHKFERKISSINDIIQAQTIHYKIVNGRSIVHAIEQGFTDHDFAFSIINTIIFLIFTTLIVQYVAPSSPLRHKYILWLTIVLCLLLLFPYQESLWISVNYGLNYLWPATMSVAFLLIWDRMLYDHIKPIWNIPIAIFAFIFGWSHEGFVVALAGASFLYYCFNFSKFRKQTLVLCIPFWISACIMVFAPGNINRFFHGGGDSSLFIKLTNGFDNILHLWMLWFLIIGIIVLFLIGKKHQIISFCSKNKPLLLVFSISFLFSMIANTAPYSHTMVELTSLLLILKYICTQTNFNTKSFKLASCVLSTLFVIQQVILVYDTIKTYQKQHFIIETYRNTDNNIFDPHSNIFFSSIPYIRLWDGRQSVFYTRCFSNVYGYNTDKRNMIFLKKEDITAMANPKQFFTPEQRFPGSAPAYKDPCGDYIWIHPDSLQVSGKLYANLYPVDWHHDVQLLVKLKFALFPDSYNNIETLSIDTINSQYGQAYRIKPFAVRKIKSIEIKD